MLQSSDPNAAGYIVREGMTYCQRCYRLTHYNQNTAVVIEPLTTLEPLKKVSGRFVWIIDVMDLETSLNSQFMDLYREKECWVVANKCDLLPATYGDEKITDYLRSRLTSRKIQLKGILLRGRDHCFRDRFVQQLVQDGRDIVITGIANVGKSTVINELLQEKKLTVNRNPSTTLDLNPIKWEYGTIVDTVGLVDGSSVQAYLKNDDIKRVVPDAEIRPTVFQLTGNQSLAIAGLAKIDITDCQNVTAVVYMSNLCKVGRNNYDHSEQFWQTHYGKELLPVLTDSRYEDFASVSYKPMRGKRDICIEGAGWICISGSYSRITVKCDKRIRIRNRKAMI